MSSVHPRRHDNAVDDAAIMILRRLNLAPMLLAEHADASTGVCTGPHMTTTQWPCHLATLCRAALDTGAGPLRLVEAE